MLKKSVSKVRGLLKRISKDVKTIDIKDPLVLSLVLLFVSFPVIIGLAGYKIGIRPDNDIRQATVMIGSLTTRGGGTGIILSSTSKASTVLTNAHVCQLVANSGVIESGGMVYQVATYQISRMSDLCLLSVRADLGINTKVSPDAPSKYEKATVAGHPALLPTVITEGHFSGRRIVPVVVGFRKCTDEDAQGPYGLYCAFFGGIPVVRNFESVLVTATIMPGSSGSGVYDSDMNLVGVVFAGSGELGYAWTVPYEQLIAFLSDELSTLPVQLPNHKVSLGGSSSEEKAKNYKGFIVERCASEHGQRYFKEFCNMIQQDIISEN